MICFTVTITNWIALFCPFGKCLLTNKIRYTSNSINIKQSVYARHVFIIRIYTFIYTYLFAYLLWKDSWIDVNVNSFCFIKSKYWCWLWGIFVQLYIAITQKKPIFFGKTRQSFWKKCFLIDQCTLYRVLVNLFFNWKCQ